MDAAERQVALKRLLGLAIVFGLAFVISAWLPSPRQGSDEQVLVVPLREAPARAAPPPSTAAAPASDSSGSAAPSAAPASASSKGRTTAAPPPASTVRKAPAPAAAPPPGGERAGGEAAVQWWVQAAAYRDRDVARRGEARLQALKLPAQLQATQVAGTQLWRLRAGPFASHEAAEAARERLEAEGFAGARSLSIP